MNVTPKVSIIVVLFRADEQDVRRGIDSVLSQTLRDIEVIIVDGSSEHQYASLCQEYSAQDSRISILLSPGASLGRAYNDALRHACGEYVGFVGEQDWVEKDMYEQLHVKALEHDVQVVKCLASAEDLSEEFGDPFGMFLYNIRITEIKKLPAIVVQKGSLFEGGIYQRSFLERADIRFPEENWAHTQSYGEAFLWSVYARLRSCYIIPLALYSAREDESSSAPNLTVAQETLSLHHWVWEHYKKSQAPSYCWELLYPYIFGQTIPELYDAFGFGNKLRFARAVSNTWKPHLEQLRADPSFGKYYYKRIRSIVSSPAAYFIRTQVCHKVIVRGVKKKSFLGVEVLEQGASPLPFRRIFGIPYYSEKQKGGEITSYLLGIPFRTKRVPEDLLQEKLNEKISEYGKSLLMSCHALAIYHLHQKTFPKYKNSLRDWDVVIVATGQTAQFAPSLSSFTRMKYVAVNRAITWDKYHFDYCFMQDWVAVRGYISKIFDYGCTNFFGQIIFPPEDRVFNIPDHIAQRAHAERYHLIAGWGGVPAYHEIDCFPLPSWGSVTHSALAFLLYTNPRRIYLVGCDTAQTGYFDKRVKQQQFKIECVKSGYYHLKNIRDTYYPDTEIISINPVGLKGLFHDVYTKSYLASHPEIDPSTVEIINK